jgi:Sulfatase-modifying factor enzyme 1
MIYAGSLVFVKPHGRVDRRNIGNWWQFMKGADWRHLYGPGSSIEDLQQHLVVHVAYSDAEALRSRAWPTCVPNWAKPSAWRQFRHVVQGPVIVDSCQSEQ